MKNSDLVLQTIRTFNTRVYRTLLMPSINITITLEKYI